MVYLIDQTSIGRASQRDFAGYPLRIGSTAEIAEGGFSVPEKTNAYPQSQLYNQWPRVSVLPRSPWFKVELTSTKPRLA